MQKANREAISEARCQMSEVSSTEREGRKSGDRRGAPGATVSSLLFAERPTGNLRNLRNLWMNFCSSFFVLRPSSFVRRLSSSVPRSPVPRLRSPSFVLRSSVLGPRSSVFGLRSLVPVLAALLLVAGWASAQSAPSQQAPVFKYYVWGQVRGPGAYSLSANPDLVELLSAAGGPTEYADVRHVTLIRAVTQKRIGIDLKKMLGAGQVVPLSPGDIVMVPNSPWYSIRDGLEITTTVVSFATLILTIMTWAAR
jgi:hypothetical protein